MKRCISIVTAVAALSIGSVVFANGTRDNHLNVTVREAPYVISSVSSKTVRGSAPCQYCSATIRYDRTFRWDVYNHQWVETTGDDVPKMCRKCRQRFKGQENLDKEERALDKSIEYLETKERIKRKRERLSRLRNGN